MAILTDLYNELKERLLQLKGDTAIKPVVAEDLKTTALPDSPKFYSSVQAKSLFNVDLPDSDYMLKVTPNTKGYQYSYVTPTNHELRDDGILNDPNGQPLSPDIISDKNSVFGNALPQTTVKVLQDYVRQNPDTFKQTIQKVGMNEKSLNLVNKMFPTAQPEQIKQLFGVTQPETSDSIWDKIKDLFGVEGTIASKIMGKETGKERENIDSNINYDPQSGIYKVGEQTFASQDAARNFVKTGYTDTGYSDLTPEEQAIKDKETEANKSRWDKPLVPEGMRNSVFNIFENATPSEILKSPELNLALLGAVPAPTLSKVTLLADSLVNAGFGAGMASDTFAHRKEMTTAQLILSYGLSGLAIGGGGLQAKSVLGESAQNYLNTIAKNQGYNSVQEMLGSEAGFARLGKGADEPIAKYKDYQEVHNAFKKGELKIGDETTVGAYGGQVVKISPPEYKGELGQDSLPLKYRIKSIRPLKQESTTPPTTGQPLNDLKQAISTGDAVKVKQVATEIEQTATDANLKSKATFIKNNPEQVVKVAKDKLPQNPQAEAPKTEAVSGGTLRERKPLWAGKTDVPVEQQPLKNEPFPESMTLSSGRKPPEPPKDTSVSPNDWQPSSRKAGGEQNMTPDKPIDVNKLSEESIAPEVKSLRTKLTEAKDTFMRAMYQDIREIKRLSEKVGGDAWKLAKSVPGSRTWGERLIEKYTQPIYNKVGKDLPEFARYLVHKRNEDILARFGQDTKLANNIPGWAGNLKALEGIKAKVGEARFAEFEQLAKELYKNTEENTIGALYKAGIIDETSYLNLRTSYPHYIPFGRQGYDKNVVDSIKSVANVSADGIKQMEETGSTRKLMNVLASNDANIIKVQERIAKNEAAKAIINDLESLYKTTGEKMQWVENPDVAKDTLKLPIRDDEWDTISFFKDGKRYTANIPKPVAVAAKAMERTESIPLLRFVKALAMPLMKGAVVYNPAYVPVNISRDALSAFYRERLIPLSPSYIQGWKAAITKNAWFDEATKAGTLNSGIVETMLKGDKIKPVGRMAGAIPFNNLGDYLLSPARFMEKLNLTAEQATRLGVYIKKRSQGVSKIDAAVAGRDATVDFAQTGTVMKDINMIVPFSNASLQGAANTVRTLKDHPAWAATVAGAFIVPTAICRLNNMKYESSKDIPSYEFTNYWVYQVGEYTKPDGTPAPIYTKIPKGQIAAMFTFPVEAGFNYQNSKNDKSFAKVLWQNFVGTLQSTSPVPTDASGFLPPLLDTAVNIQANQNMYTGMPIVSQSEQSLLPEQQFGEDTSKLAIALGQQFQISPRKIDFAMKNYTAGAGQTVLYMMDKAAEGLGYDPEIYGASNKEPQGLAKELSQTPIISRFIGAKATEKERIAWENFDRVTEDTNRQFSKLPEVNSLGLKLGDVGSSIHGIELKTSERSQYQAVVAKVVTAVMPQLLQMTTGKDPAVRKELIQKFMTDLKGEVGNQYLATVRPEYAETIGEAIPANYLLKKYTLQSQWYDNDKQWDSYNDPYDANYIQDEDERAAKRTSILEGNTQYHQARILMQAYQDGIPESEMSGYVNYKMGDYTYDSYGDENSQNYIADEKKRAEARVTYLKQNTTYAQEKYKRQAVSQGIPESYTSQYMEYSMLPSSGEGSTTKRNQWLLSHSDYYTNVWLKILGNQPVKSTTSSTSSSTYQPFKR